MIINLKSETDLSAFYVVFDGSVDIENKGEYGVSHLMEHLVCKAVDHLQDDYDIEGIEFNAYTSQSNIVFYIKGLDDKVNNRKSEFLELISNFNITKEEFENEKKIVLEEYLDSFQNPTSWHYLNLDRKLFNVHNAIGLKDDIANFTYINALDFFKKQFLKPSKIINVSKSHDFEGKVDFLEPLDKHSYEYLENNDFELEGKIDSDKTSLIFLTPFLEKDFVVSKMINSILGDGLNSPLYQEIREKKGLVYYISLYTVRMNDKGVVMMSTMTSDDNVDELQDTVKDIFDNIEDYLTQKRFDIVKESLKVRFKKNEILRYDSVGKWINGEDWDLESKLDDITLDDCIRVFKEYYNYDNLYISNSKTEFS